MSGLPTRHSPHVRPLAVQSPFTDREVAPSRSRRRVALPSPMAQLGNEQREETKELLRKLELIWFARIRSSVCAVLCMLLRTSLIVAGARRHRSFPKWSSL